MLKLNPDLPVIDNWQALFLQKTPLLDVRAPIEFHAGAFPLTTNLPLMDDADRDAIGKRYKQVGQDAAIELGLQRISGDIKKQRVQAWAEFVRQHPEGVLYCFRGGLRSKISQQWLYEYSGIRYPRVYGGYKAMRRYLLEQLEQLPNQFKWLVLTGRTGTGKTRFLPSVQQHIDLEKLAHHRGSAFGAYPSAQPAQISFENALAIELLRHAHAGHQVLLVEDESRRIGSLHLPEILFNQLCQAPVIAMQVDTDTRLELTYQEYIIDALQAFTQTCAGDETAGLQAFAHYLHTSLGKIERRLSGMRYQKAIHLLQQALALHQQTGNLDAHQGWIKYLLLNYYDPMYDFQISRKQQRLVFQGTPAEISAYLQSVGIR